MPTEVEQIKDRYARRAMAASHGRYDLVNPTVYMSVQERERALLRWIRDNRIAPLASRRLIEIGCGSGQNLLDLLRFGFQPENMVGNELLPERVEAARRRLPPALSIVQGDAMQLDIPAESFDVVFQSTVFSSILEASFQEALAARMWRWVAPGGGVLWYDFTFDNPRNPDVAGVPVRRIKALFPEGHLKCWRITLAPPLARLVTRVHPALYTLANSMPFLRTHVLCWIKKEPKPAFFPGV
jgi:SAM-dependent methyltransferase